MIPSHPGDDDPRDPHLLQALRHAPDDAAPPTAVRDAILRAARDAAAPRPASWWQRLSDWLVRPQVAGAFASIAVVTVAGLLWHDEPVPPMSAPEPELVLDKKKETAPAAPAVEQAAPPPEVAAEPAPAAEKRAARPERSPARTDADVIAPPAAPKPSLPPVTFGEADTRPRLTELPGVAAPPPPSPDTVYGQPDQGMPRDSESAAVAPAPAPPPLIPEEARAPSPAKAAAAGAPREGETERLALDGRVRSEVARARTRPGFAQDTSPIRPLRQAVMSQPDWRWQRETGDAQASDQRLWTWLALLDRTVPVWQPVDTPRTGAAELLLIHDGRTAHRFVLTDDGLWWFGPEGGRRAEIDAVGLRRLRAALP